MAVPTTSSAPAVVELVISGPRFSDAEHFEIPTDRAARAFAREVMDFALNPRGHSRRRSRATTLKTDADGKE